VTTVSVKLTRALVARLDAVAAERRTSRSTLIRQALERDLQRRPGRRARSFAALARDFAGCLSGPPDLSHDPGRLRGYGR
jgi:predicted transcriptional regulator